MQGAALFGTLARHLEELGDAVAVFGCDGEFGGAKQRVTDVGVEAAVVAGLVLPKGNMRALSAPPPDAT